MCALSFLEVSPTPGAGWRWMTGSPWGQEEQRTSENRGEGLFGKSLANSSSKGSHSTYYVLVLGWALEAVFISLHTPLQWLLLLSVKRKWRTTEISNLPKVMHAEGQSEDSPQQWTGDFAFTNPGALSYSTWVCLHSPCPPMLAAMPTGVTVPREGVRAGWQTVYTTAQPAHTAVRFYP